MKIVHASDIHLDSPLRGLARYDGAPVDALRGATRRALAGLVDLAIAERAAVVLISGDLYDGDWRDYGTGLAFVAEMRRLREAGIQVITIRGNHDAESQISRNLKLPDNVRELANDRPESVELEELGIAVHGRGFATQKVTEDLARGYPPAIRGVVNFGMLHTALGGREGHETYAPTSVEVLSDKGYDYWALGHIHTREIVRETPWIVFPGNLQGRHIRETGAKGATLITVEGSKIVGVEHRALDVVRYADLRVDARSADDEATVWERVRSALSSALSAADGRLLAARVTVVGATRAHASFAKSPERFESQVRGIGLDVGGDALFVGEVRAQTSLPIDLESIAGGDDALGQIVRHVRALGASSVLPDELAAELEDLKGRLPADLLEHPDAAFLHDPEDARALLSEVEQTILARLCGARLA